MDRQAFVFNASGAGCRCWTRELLLVNLGDDLWVCADPNGKLATVSLSVQDKIVVKASSRRFDGAGSVEKLMEKACALADSLAYDMGEVSVGADVGGVWRIADTAVAGFGGEVPKATMSLEGDSVLMVGRQALVRGLDVCKPGEWVYCEKVKGSELDSWKKLKLVGLSPAVCLDGASVSMCEELVVLPEGLRSTPGIPRGSVAVGQFLPGVLSAELLLSSSGCSPSGYFGKVWQDRTAITRSNINAVLSLLRDLDEVDFCRVGRAEVFKQWGEVLEGAARRDLEVCKENGEGASLSFALDEMGLVIVLDVSGASAVKLVKVARLECARLKRMRVR